MHLFDSPRLFLLIFKYFYKIYSPFTFNETGLTFLKVKLLFPA